MHIYRNESLWLTHLTLTGNSSTIFMFLPLSGKGVTRGQSRIKEYHDGSLVVTDVKGTDAGNYTCTANNLYGSDAITYSVTVQGKLSHWQHLDFHFAWHCPEKSIAWPHPISFINILVLILLAFKWYTSILSFHLVITFLKQKWMILKRAWIVNDSMINFNHIFCKCTENTNLACWIYIIVIIKLECIQLKQRLI